MGGKTPVLFKTRGALLIIPGRIARGLERLLKKRSSRAASNQNEELSFLQVPDQVYKDTRGESSRSRRILRRGEAVPGRNLSRNRKRRRSSLKKEAVLQRGVQKLLEAGKELKVPTRCSSVYGGKKQTRQDKERENRGSNQIKEDPNFKKNVLFTVRYRS